MRFKLVIFCLAFCFISVINAKSIIKWNCHVSGVNLNNSQIPGNCQKLTVTDIPSFKNTNASSIKAAQGGYNCANEYNNVSNIYGQGGCTTSSTGNVYAVIRKTNLQVITNKGKHYQINIPGGYLQDRTQYEKTGVYTPDSIKTLNSIDDFDEEIKNELLLYVLPVLKACNGSLSNFCSNSN
jgi:hypothetical protein